MLEVQNEADGINQDPNRHGIRHRAVVVHGGARDSYQLALGLSQHGLLETLVTDLFWPSSELWAQRIECRLAPHWRELLARRSAGGLRFAEVIQCTGHGLLGLLLDRVPGVPFSIKCRANRSADVRLGRTAGRLARDSNTGLVSYSYFAYDAMREYGRPAMLFQVHPHPETVRRLLRQELNDHPECATSLLQEWELALPEDDYDRLVQEPRMASHFIVASNFTRDSLIEHGTPAHAITVVPYGVDLQRFHPASPQASRTAGPLELLFVGRINQRKGIKYLLEVLRLLDSEDVRLTVCGRVVDDLDIFRPFGDRIRVRPSISSQELSEAYRAADLFVFPSVAEGFGQVLLEALASGLPILSTTHTAAPDLIEEGLEGFIVEPRRPDLLAERIGWALSHRAELAAMRHRARACAERFTWQRFREASASAVARYFADVDSVGTV